MTTEEMLALPAGPDLDALIATRVLGYRRVRQTTTRTGRIIHIGDAPEEKPNDGPSWKLPGFSTSIVACWPVHDWLRERWGQFELTAGLEWHCKPDAGSDYTFYCGSGETPMLAIVRAALKATRE